MMVVHRIDFQRPSGTSPERPEQPGRQEDSTTAEIIDFPKIYQAAGMRPHPLFRDRPEISQARHNAAMSAFDLNAVPEHIREDVRTMLEFAESDEWRQSLQALFGVRPRSDSETS